MWWYTQYTFDTVATMFVIYVTIDSFVVVVCHLYCCYNFLDRCKRHDCDGTMIDDGYGFDDGMGGDEL